MNSKFNREKFKTQSIKIAKEFVKNLKNKDDFIAIFVGGSIARGNFLSSSDIDLFLIYKDKYKKKYKDYHIKSQKYKNYRFSLGYIGQTELPKYIIKTKDPSILSSLQSPIIIFDPTNFLIPLVKKAKKTKLLSSSEKKEKIKRTYNLVNEHLKYIEGAFKSGEQTNAAYSLKKTLDFILERKRLFANDPLYDHFKTAIEFLNQIKEGEPTFTKIFSTVNLTMNEKTLLKTLKELKRLTKQKRLF